MMNHVRVVCAYKCPQIMAASYSSFRTMKLLIILGVLLMTAIVQSKKKQNRVIIIITDKQQAAKRGLEAEPRLDNDLILGTRDVDLQNEELKRDLDETMEDHVKKEADTFGV